MILTFEEFSLNENNKSSIKKGDKVEVVMELFSGKPSYNVIAYNDSFHNEHTQSESFSFLSGDMMMIAKWDGEKYVSN